MCRMLIAVIWRVHGGSFPHYHHFQNITIHLQWLRRAHLLMKPPVTGHSGPAVTTIVEFKKMSVDLWGHFLWFSYENTHHQSKVWTQLLKEFFLDVSKLLTGGPLKMMGDSFLSNAKQNDTLNRRKHNFGAWFSSTDLLCG